MKEYDMSANIMNERLEFGIRMIKNLCSINNIVFDKDMMIKATEVGISLYIQKERAYQQKR